jgi:hypothetical protein
MIGRSLARRVAAITVDPGIGANTETADSGAPLGFARAALTLLRAASKPLLAVVVVVHLLAKAFTDIDIYDEGIRLYGAMRVLDGDVPYRDFFTMYGPAQFYWPAIWFGVFGEQLWAARMSELLFAVATVASMAMLLRRANVGPTGVLWAVGSILLPLIDVKLITIDPSFALELFAGVALTSAPTKRRLVSGGLLLGCASLFRHDFALYGALAAAAALTVGAYTTEPPGLRAKAATFSISIVALSALAVALPMYGMLALADPVALWDCLAVKPPELMELRRIPYSHALAQTFAYLTKTVSPNNCLRVWVMLSPVLVPASVLLLGHQPLRFEVTRHPRRAATFTFLMTLGAGLSAYALARNDVFHLYPAHIMYAGALTILTGAALGTANDRRGSLQLRVALSLLISGALVAGMLSSLGRLRNRETIDSERVQGIHVAGGGRWLAQAVDDVNRHAGTGPIFVGSVRHDRVVANLMTAYFMTGRRAATYYHDIMPGLTTTEPVQKKMIADIAESGACAALLWDTQSDEPNRSSTDRGATLLDEYLARHFRVVVERKGYRVLARCGQAER